MARPMTATQAKRLAKDFADEQAKGSILGGVLLALFSKLLQAFIERLLEKYDVIPKETA